MMSSRLYWRAVWVLVLPLLLSLVLLYGETKRIERVLTVGSPSLGTEERLAASYRAGALRQAETQLGPPILPARPEERVVRETRTVYRDVEVAGGIARVPVQATIEEKIPPSPTEIAAWRRRQLDLESQHEVRIAEVAEGIVADRLAAERRAGIMVWIGLALPLPAILLSWYLFRRARSEAREEREMMEEERAFLSTPSPR